MSVDAGALLVVIAVNLVVQLRSRAPPARGPLRRPAALAIARSRCSRSSIVGIADDRSRPGRARAGRDAPARSTSSGRAHRPLSIHLLTGRVLVERPDDRRAAPGRPSVLHRRSGSRSSLDWSAGVRAEAGDHHHVGRDDRLADARREVGRRGTTSRVHAATTAAAGGRSRFTTTLKYLRACAASSRTRITRRRGASSAATSTSTSGTCRSITGTATFTGGTVTIQDYVPMWANMKARVRDRRPAHSPRSHRPRHRRRDDRRRTATSTSAHWPEQTLPGEVAREFPRMREMFFTDETWELAGDGDFTGTFHLFKGGRDLTGTFTSDLARRQRLPVSRAVRLAALDAARVRRLERRREVLRRRREVHLFGSSRSAHDARPIARFDDDV